ncbi:MAG: N-6 DNA methylase, partial [Patescibacteria group bacterium]
RISDGQLLFLQHMLGRMKDSKDGGSRVAIIMNGSPLFNGDAGSGESEIRRWVLANDWLEALVAMPEQLFYNTDIATYVWILTNRKERKRKGKVQLINASNFWVPLRKSLGDKRREISSEQIKQITDLFTDFKEGEHCKIFDTTDFGYRKITIEMPLRLNFQASPQRTARLKDETAFQNLAISKKKNPKDKAAKEAEGQKEQDAILAILKTIPSTMFKDRNDFEAALEKSSKASAIKLSAAIRKAILSALSERDETADICRDEDGNPKPDPELRDYENVPLKEDIQRYFEREVKQYIPDAWINTAIVDHKDSKVGKAGYEINFNRYFSKYEPLRSLEAIEADIKSIEQDIVKMLGEVTQ